MRAIEISALYIHVTNMDFLAAIIDIYIYIYIYVNKSVCNDDDQSYGDEDDGGWWWRFLGNDVDDDFFGLLRINVTNVFIIASLQKNIYITQRYTCFLLPPMQVFDITLMYSCIHQLLQHYKFALICSWTQHHEKTSHSGELKQLMEKHIHGHLGWRN